MKVSNTYKAAILVFAFAAIGSFFSIKHASANASLSFSAAQNGPLPAAKSPTASNTTPSSGQAMNWTSSVAYNGAQTGWLTYNPASGNNLGPGGSVPLSVRPNTTNLTPGTHTATITVTGVSTFAGKPALSAPQTITVNFTIASPCTIIVTSTYNGVSNAAPPGNFTFVISGPTTFRGTGPQSITVDPATQSGNYTASSPTGGLVDINPSNSASCSPSGGSTLNYDFVFQDEPPCSGVSNCPNAENFLINPAVACGQVRINWTTGRHMSQYYIYRTATPAAPAPNNPLVIVGANVNDPPGNDASYSYAAPTSPNYYYWVAGNNSVTGLTAIKGPTASIGPSECIVDLRTSNKVFTDVNGANYPYTSNCIGNQSGSFPVIMEGDTVTSSINICNSGTIDATNARVLDVLSGLTVQDPSVPPNFRLNGAPIAGSISGNCSTGTCQVSFNLGTIRSSGAGSKAVLTFNAKVVSSASQTDQTLNRIRNYGDVTFSSALPSDNGACHGTGTDAAHPCRLDTGYIVFYNGIGAPTQKEINP